MIISQELEILSNNQLVYRRYFLEIIINIDYLIEFQVPVDNTV